MPVQVFHGSALPEMLDPEAGNDMAMHRAQPTESRGVAVDHRDHSGMPRQGSKQALDVAFRRSFPAASRALGSLPSRVQAVRRGDGQNADVTPVLADHAR